MTFSPQPPFLETLSQASFCIIRQIRDLAELVGYETRNRYSIHTKEGHLFAFAAEQKSGFSGFLLRQVIGHWRTFDIHLFDSRHALQVIAHHPFRFYFKRIDVRSADGKPIGSIERRFDLLRKRFSVLGPDGASLMEMESPLFSFWQFPVFRQGQEIARIQKKWGGAITELFLDADTFSVHFQNSDLSCNDRLLLLVATLFIDIQYFEFSRPIEATLWIPTT